MAWFGAEAYVWRPSDLPEAAVLASEEGRVTALFGGAAVALHEGELVARSADCDAKKAAKAKRRERRSKHRRCFWSWPPGHCWHNYTSPYDYRQCCHCGKRQIRLV